MKHSSLLSRYGTLLISLCLAACSHSDEAPALQQSSVPQFSARSIRQGDVCTYIGIADGAKAFGHNATYNGSQWVWSDATTTVDWKTVSHFAIAYPAWNPSVVTNGAATLTQAELPAYLDKGLMLGAYTADQATNLSVHQQLARLDILWHEDYPMNRTITLHLAPEATVQLNVTAVAPDYPLLTVTPGTAAYECDLTQELQNGDYKVLLPVFPQTFAAGSVLFSYSTGSEADGDLRHHYFRIPQGKDFTVGANESLRVTLKEQSEDEESISATITVSGISVSDWLPGDSLGEGEAEEQNN